MAFSPDGATLAAGSNALQWWNVTTHKLIAQRTSPGATSHSTSRTTRTGRSWPRAGTRWPPVERRHVPAGHNAEPRRYSPSRLGRRLLPQRHGIQPLRRNPRHRLLRHSRILERRRGQGTKPGDLQRLAARPMPRHHTPASMAGLDSRNLFPVSQRSARFVPCQNSRTATDQQFSLAKLGTKDDQRYRSGPASRNHEARRHPLRDPDRRYHIVPCQTPIPLPTTPHSLFPAAPQTSSAQWSRPVPLEY